MYKQWWMFIKVKQKQSLSTTRTCRQKACWKAVLTTLSKTLFLQGIIHNNTFNALYILKYKVYKHITKWIKIGYENLYNAVCQFDLVPGVRNRKFYLVPGVKNGKIYLVPNDSYEKFYLAVKGLRKLPPAVPFLTNRVLILPHVMHWPRLIKSTIFERSSSDIFSFCYKSTL